jgi:hypothetical protein
MGGFKFQDAQISTLRLLLGITEKSVNASLRHAYEAKIG